MLDADIESAYIGSHDGYGDTNTHDELATQPYAEDMGTAPTSAATPQAAQRGRTARAAHQSERAAAGATTAMQQNVQDNRTQPQEFEHSPTDREVVDALHLAESLIAGSDLPGAARPTPFRAARRAAKPYPQVTVVEDIP